jgi:hypothetical protein
MPNGDDKNLVRLRLACGAYRQRYDEWPSQARLHPLVLWDLARVLGPEQFVKLATHLQLRTKDRAGLTVGGRGVIDYDDVDHQSVDEHTRRLVEQWLDVRQLETEH